MLKHKSISTTQFPELNYRIAGEGPALMLIHGFPATGELWSDVWEPLSKDYKVIMPDLPGSGDSKRAKDELTMELMAEAMQLVLATEGIKQAVIAGHSMGGYTAIAFAEMYPEMMKGLVMVHSLATDDYDEKKENRRKSISLIEKGGKEAFVKQMIPALFSESFKQKHPEVVKNHIDKGLEQDAESLIAFYNAMINRPNRLHVLAGAGFAVQWIIGQEDNIASPAKVLQQTTLASVNFVTVYDDCAHMCMIEQPAKIIDDMSAFCRYCYVN